MTDERLIRMGRESKAFNIEFNDCNLVCPIGQWKCQAEAESKAKTKLGDGLKPECGNQQRGERMRERHPLRTMEAALLLSADIRAPGYPQVLPERCFDVDRSKTE